MGQSRNLFLTVTGGSKEMLNLVLSCNQLWLQDTPRRFEEILSSTEECIITFMQIRAPNLKEGCPENFWGMCPLVPW